MPCRMESNMFKNSGPITPANNLAIVNSTILQSFKYPVNWIVTFS